MSYFAVWSPFLFLSLFVLCSWESQSLKSVLTRLPSPHTMQIKQRSLGVSFVSPKQCKLSGVKNYKVLHVTYILFTFSIISFQPSAFVTGFLSSWLNETLFFFSFFFFGYAVSVLCVYSVPSISWRQSCILLPLQFQTWPRLRHRLAVSSPTRCWCARSWGSLLSPPTLCSALWDAHSVNFCLL